jgi:hypothetical protein
METLLAAIIAFVVAQTGMTAPVFHPIVEFKTSCEIRRHFYNEPTRECDKHNSIDVAALYDHNIKTIMLNSNWSATDLSDVALLVHEVTHFIQDENGVVMGSGNACHGQIVEKPAYEAQFAFLKAAGVDPYITSGIDEIGLLLATRCRNAYEG